MIVPVATDCPYTGPRSHPLIDMYEHRHASTVYDTLQQSVMSKLNSSRRSSDLPLDGSVLQHSVRAC